MTTFLIITFFHRKFHCRMHFQTDLEFGGFMTDLKQLVQIWHCHTVWFWCACVWMLFTNVALCVFYIDFQLDLCSMVILMWIWFNENLVEFCLNFRLIFTFKVPRMCISLWVQWQLYHAWHYTFNARFNSLSCCRS